MALYYQLSAFRYEFDDTQTSYHGGTMARNGDLVMQNRTTIEVPREVLADLDRIKRAERLDSKASVIRKLIENYEARANA